MENKHLTLPDQKNYDLAYELAYKLVCEKLTGIEDIEQQCRRSGARCRDTGSGKEILVEFLNQTYKINLPDIEISLESSSGEVSIKEKLLILHYFTSAKGTPLADKLITFRDLPAGTVYYPTFLKRTVKPLLANFGKQPELLMKAAEKLGARRADYGDTAVTIDAFSLVPITIILWRGDDEFAPDGSVAFDATIPEYLPTEDITVLCETIAWKLVKYLKESEISLS